MNCVCTLKDLQIFGVRVAQGQTLCNNCNKEVTSETAAKLADLPAANAESMANLSAMGGALLKTKVSDPAAAGRDVKINEIIRRMWIWISAQACFIGIWAGAAYPQTNFGDGDSGYSQSFNFGMFLVGVFFGIGAFAPLVFVVEALREVILNIIKGPEQKS